MTNLTEEQMMYVNSIQQACHAINVIAGNVLGKLLYLVSAHILMYLADFSKVCLAWCSSNKGA